MKRLRFEHFHVELSVALEKLVPRYALWLHMCELDFSPEKLERSALLRFFDGHLDDFLAAQRVHLESRQKARLRKTLMRYDPAQPTPYDFMERVSAPLS